MAIKINLRQVIYALADALDLIATENAQHSKRVAKMALECGKLLQFDKTQLDTILHAALLHDFGISEKYPCSNILSDKHWEWEWRNAVFHCERGYRNLFNIKPLANIAPIILHHHRRWEMVKHLTLSSFQKLAANLLFLLDRIDAFIVSHIQSDILACKEIIREKVIHCQGDLFAPEVIEAFLAASEKEAFWLSLETNHLYRCLWKIEQHHHETTINLVELKQLAMMFSILVDAKSRFTQEHSIGVARLARFFAEHLGFPSETCDKLEIAGLLHDLGKLKIPSEILEKPAPLTLAERSVINHHSYETYQILCRIDGIQDIATWAGNHHERPDGSGYPFRLKGDEVTLEMQIIGVADMFQALAQNRPYRASLPPSEIFRLLRDSIECRGMDKRLFAVIEKDLETCWRIAIGESGGELPIPSMNSPVAIFLH